MVFSFAQAVGQAGNNAKKLLSQGLIGPAGEGAALNAAQNDVITNAVGIDGHFNAYEPLTYATSPVYHVVRGFLDNLSQFYEFLAENKIIASTIGIVIGLQMNGLWGAITDDIINPITKKLLKKDIDDLNFCVFGITFYYGKIINSLINILISFFFLYKLYQLTKSIGLK
jgi:large-conductance mechanosensitive channel